LRFRASATILLNLRRNPLGNATAPAAGGTRIRIDATPAEDHEPHRDPFSADRAFADGRVTVLHLLRERIAAFPSLQTAFRRLGGVLARRMNDGLG